MVLGWNLQDSRNWSGVRVDDVTDELSQVLVDQNDVNVITLHETFEAIFDLTDSGICVRKDYFFLKFQSLIFLTFVNDHKVWVAVLVDLADSTEEESNTSILE